LQDHDLEKIQSLNPEMKFIFIIRNPIERAWSAVRFFRKKDRGVDLDMWNDEDIITLLKMPGTLQRGDYEQTLQKYRKRFKQGHILLCFYDAIQDNPKGLLDSIADFLAISPFRENEIDGTRRINSAPPGPVPEKVAGYLQDLYSPMIDRMARQYGSYCTCWQIPRDRKNLVEVPVEKKPALRL
jgi:hypothetical protein